MTEECTVDIGDIVSAVTTTYLGTRLWDVKITGINPTPDSFLFSPNNWLYTGETVCGPVTIHDKQMVHNNHTKGWPFTEAKQSEERQR